MAQLEIACFNFESALIAQQNGADRVELCDGFEVGGTTPSEGKVIKISSFLTIDYYVMIRPRGGDFIYTQQEFEQMKLDIITFKKYNINGFVFGILKEGNKVNMEQNKALVELAKPLPCTFHKAFDEAADASQSLEDIINCGFKTILTSGQAPNVNDGLNRIADLVKQAANRIEIMPGGSLRSSNIGLVQQQSNAIWFHSSAITDGSQMASATEVEALKSNLK